MKDNKDRIKTNEQIHNIAVKLQKQQEIKENMLKGTFLENKTSKNVEKPNNSEENGTKKHVFTRTIITWVIIVTTIGGGLIPAIILAVTKM